MQNRMSLYKLFKEKNSAVKKGIQRLSYADKDDAKKVLEGLKETIDYASRGRFTVLTVHPALYNPGKQGYIYSEEAEKYLRPEEAWKVSIELLRELARYAERKGIMLSLENMPV